MTIAFCLDCDREIELESSVRRGQRITCPYCEVKLEIISLDPLKLDWVYDGPHANFGIFNEEWNSLSLGNSPNRNK